MAPQRYIAFLGSMKKDVWLSDLIAAGTFVFEPAPARKPKTS
jgi:hypothetical protein